MTFFRLRLLLPALCCLSGYLCAQNYPADTLYGTQWEHLDFPSTRVIGFAKSGGVHFAATNQGLYRSFDGGENWQVHPFFGSTGDVFKVLATEQIVWVQISRTVSSSGSQTVRFMDFYRSLDHGATFTLSLSLDNSFHYFDCIYDVRGIYAKNDGTFFIPWLNTHCNQPANLFERILYTDDLGATWKTRPSVGRLNYAASGDVVTGYSLNNNQLRLCITTANDFSNTVATTVLPPANAGTVMLLVQHQGTLYLWSQHKRLYRSTDQGLTWSSDSLAVPGNKITSAQIADGLFYVTTELGIYRLSPVSAPAATQLYNRGVGDIFGFQKLDNELWVNDLFRTTHVSEDGGLTWSDRSRGLAGQTYGIRQWCDYLVVQPSSQQDTANFRSKTGGQWQLVTASPGAGTYFSNYIGESGGWLFINANNVIRRSGDCGLTWETCPAQPAGLPASPTNTGLLRTASGNGRFYLHYPNDNQRRVWHTADGGTTWAMFQSPQQEIRHLFVAGDTVFVLSAVIVSRTVDLGAGWTHVVMQDGFQGDANWRLGQTFVATGNLNSQLQLYVSNDQGATWTQTCTDFYDYGSPTNVIQVPIKYVKDSFLFIHAARGLYVSKNYGVNWLRIADLPFFTEHPAGQPPLEGAWEYLLKDDYLYAATFDQGVWRCPWQPILDALNTTQGAYGTVEGRVFRDRNQNCTFDAGDAPMSGRMIRLTPGNYYTVTGPDGTYRFAAPAGTYQVETVLPDNTQDVCDPLQFQTVTLAPGGVVSAHFPIYIVPGVYDLCVNLALLQALRPGFPTAFLAQVINVGSEAVSGATITFTFDPTFLTFTGASLPAQVNGSAITLTVPDLAPDEKVDLLFYFTVLPVTPLNTELVATVNVALPNDAHPNNNTGEWYARVRGSYDPNDKSVHAAEPLTPGSPHPLLYVIRFQNTGTDTAFNVVVTDTIDPKLDLLTLETVAASHDYSFSVAAGRVVRWTFKGIGLPDSTTNEAASHGFIAFKIKTFALADQEKIANRADIFFDFNEPVVTNTVETTIEKWKVLQTTEVEICAGEQFNGQVFTSSTVRSDTVSTVTTDSIFITRIQVHPVYNYPFFVRIPPGGEVLGTAYWHDTIVTVHNLTVAGCDSNKTYYIHIVPRRSTASLHEALRAAPNPAVQGVWISMETATAQALTDPLWQLYDLTGRPVRQGKFSAPDMYLPRGDLPDGVYILKIMDKGQMVEGVNLIFAGN